MLEYFRANAIFRCLLQFSGLLKMSDISFVIPVYHALQEVKNCLRSLEQVENLDGTEIILVNDCPGSETAEFLQQYAASFAHRHSKGCLRLINNSENLGFIKSCNRGIELAESPVIVLLNSDTAVSKKIAKKFIACFESDERIACASPLGFNKMEQAAFPADVDEADALAEEKAGSRPYLKTIVPHGFCFGIRRSVVEQIGGFDEVFGKGYCEENDLSCRALAAGYINVMMVNAYVWHKGAASFGRSEQYQRIKDNKQILDARWNRFLHDYKKTHRDLFKAKHYLRRFLPWYQNLFNRSRSIGLRLFLWLLPEGRLKSDLKRLK